MVQRTSETLVDACSGDDWTDLVDSLLDHFRHVRICVRANVPRQSELEGRSAIRHQSGGESHLYAHPIRDEESAARSRGHFDRLGHNHLDDGGNLEALSLGCGCSGAVFHLGFVGDRAATEYHGDEPVNAFCEDNRRPHKLPYLLAPVVAISH